MKPHLQMFLSHRRILSKSLARALKEPYYDELLSEYDRYVLSRVNRTFMGVLQLTFPIVLGMPLTSISLGGFP